MGRYMRKVGRVMTVEEVAVVEVPDHIAGVRTRARAALDYLELRSRRLEKAQHQKAASFGPPRKTRGSCPTAREADDDAAAASVSDTLQLTERNSRETTACSSVRKLDNARISGSPNKPSVRRTKGTEFTNAPSSRDIEEFFEEAEQLQQMIFMEKYNFDPVNDCPLPGKYEWVKLDSS